MMANKERCDLERDSTMCGDPKNWFPMRVTLKVNVEPDQLEIENFVPMTYKLLDADTDHPLRELVLAINNLIFVRSSQERISWLKMLDEVLEPLRYMMDHTIMTLCDGKMQNFMRVASRTDDNVMFLDEETGWGKEGKRVEIMGDVFEGVKGVIRRVKRCKKVVVEIKGVAVM